MCLLVSVRSEPEGRKNLDASYSFNKASVTDCGPIRHFVFFLEKRREEDPRMWKTKTERKTGEKVAVAKAYSSTIDDRKSPIQSVGSLAMQPPYPMEESNQDRKKDAVIESITSHYSLIFDIEKRYSTREKGRTFGGLL